MKNTIKDLLSLKAEHLEAHIEMEKYTLKIDNYNNTSLFFNIFLTNAISVLFAIPAFILMLFIGADAVSSSYFIVFSFFVFLILDIYNIYKSLKAKDNTNVSFSPFLFFIIIILAAISAILIFSILVSFNLSLTNYISFSLSSIGLLSLLAFESFIIFSGLNKIEKNDDNIVLLFNQKREKFLELEKQVKTKENDIINNREALLDLHDALTFDSLNRADMNNIKGLLSKITSINKEQLRIKEEEEKEKEFYKKEIENILGIKNRKDNLIIND